MKLWKLILNIAVILVAIVCAVKIWRAGTWGDYFVELAYGFAGVLCYFFPDEWQSFTGHRRWRMDQWSFEPTEWIHVSGFIVFVIAAVAILGETPFLTKR